MQYNVDFFGIRVLNLIRRRSSTCRHYYYGNSDCFTFIPITIYLYAAILILEGYINFGMLALKQLYYSIFLK